MGPHRVDSEVGRLRTVLLHRPGPELLRLTPRNNDKLLFDGIPWVARAQEEHDAFAEALRSRGVEILYVTAHGGGVANFVAAYGGVVAHRTLTNPTALAARLRPSV